MKSQILSLTLASSVVLAAAWGCSARSEDCQELRNCAADAGGGGSGATGKGGTAGKGGSGGSGTGGDGGEGQSSGGAGATAAGGGSGGEGGNVVACDLSDPAAGCTPTSNGIFVAPTGNDDNTGAMDAPVATIGKGVELAIDSGQPVFICNATYDETVELGDNADGLAIYGGFACPDAANPWTYMEGERAVIAPANPGYALQADLVENLTVTDLELVAQDGAAAGDSSIAAFVSRSENASFVRVKLVAGVGKNGDNGALTNFVYPLIDELDGDNAVGTEGGQATANACDSGNTIGATGGDGGVTPTGGGSGIPDHDGAGTAGEGGDVGTCNVNAQGGADGPNGANGASPSVVGTVSAAGWAPTPASNGEHGASGQGGGGGAGSATGGGGGGGAGACGGAGGGGGMPGGSSIALLSFDSTLVLTGCEFVTADAGDGGDGISGQAGQKRSDIEPLGGYGGDASSGTACDGGNGGRGGDGGAGAGAAGGVSVGVVFTLGVDQAAPVITDPSYTLGAEGNQGLGANGNDGIDGVAQQTLEL